jgi:Porphyranase catalytic subdomain 1/beta porphyranase A C-terminal
MMNKRAVLIGLMFFMALQIGFAQTMVTVQIDPHIGKSIRGINALDRNKFFNLGHQGLGFENKVSSQSLIDTYLNNYQINFGRVLGLVYPEVKWANPLSLFESASKPGYLDVSLFKSKVMLVDGPASTGFRSLFPANLNVAYHDYTSPFPNWMAKFSTSLTTETLPSKYDAAGEVVATILKSKFSDWARPKFYEPVNEPHYSFYNDSRMANLHKVIRDSVAARKVGTLVGGPCSSVAYYYKTNYTSLNSFSRFMDDSGASLDFYSFHVYDYLKWNPAANDFTGRVTTGLPLEGVMDSYANYAMNKYKKEIPLVVSEHGGYIIENDDVVLTALANQYFPGSGFDWEMKKRSISNYIMVKSAIRNTLVFMSHPHLVAKSIPFILLESFDWDPNYYASLLVGRNFTTKGDWVESRLVDFYKFFAGLKGNRVKMNVDDPDIQQQAFVDGNKLFVIMNNLSMTAHDATLDIADKTFTQIAIKRLSRNADFTPNFTEGSLASLDGFKLNPGEAVFITLTYPSALQENKHIDEVPYYGDKTAKAVVGIETYTVAVPEYRFASYTTLRISVGRKSGSDKKVKVIFNDTELVVPFEDSSTELEDSDDYGSIKLINIHPALLRAVNTVKVSFPDGKQGGIGSVVLRVGLGSEEQIIAGTEDEQESEIKIYPNPKNVGSDLKVKLPKEEKRVECFLMDLRGKILQQDILTDSREFILSYSGDITQGVYLLRLQMEGKVVVRKVLFKHE